MKRFFRSVLLILALLMLTAELLFFLTGNMHLNRTLAYTYLSGQTGPEIDELERFPYRTVQPGNPQPWPVSTSYGKVSPADSQLARMQGYETVSFLVIQSDSVLYDRYWENYTGTTPSNSFSMAKSILSLLIGCALTDGFIGSIEDPVALYIPEFASDERAGIRIRDLLTMSSGLAFDESYNSPFSWPARAYYGNDVNSLTLETTSAHPPGKLWKYKGGDTQLLGIILRKVLHGKSIAEYASQRLWAPLGAEATAYWSMDEMGMEKVSCCYYAGARDFARLARLMMQGGQWNGRQLIDSSYIKSAIQPVSNKDEDGETVIKYGYQWWMMEHKGYPVFYMRGILGQYVFAIPELDLIVVRLGHKRDNNRINDLPIDIFLYLDAAFSMIHG